MEASCYADGKQWQAGKTTMPQKESRGLLELDVCKMDVAALGKLFLWLKRQRCMITQTKVITMTIE